MPSLPRYQRTVFPNGLTLVSERHAHFRSMAIGIWVKAGTRHELPREAGASHFLEHMLFKGTKKRSALDIARAVDQVGGDFNAFTAREYTCFHVLMLGRDANLGLDILTDILLNSEMDAGELERERQVILQEISMVEESPEEMAHDIYYELIYGEHGLGKPILGTESSIRRMRRADVLRYFRAFYRPDELILSVAGDISHDAIKRRIGPLLKRKWPNRLSARRAEEALAPAPPIRHGTWWIERPTEQVHLLWGVPGLRYAAPDRFAAFLLNVHLGGGMSSTLFQEIREKHGMAYTVYSSNTPFRDSGVFTVYAATSMKNVALCLKLIEESVGKLARAPLSAAELRLAKENLKGSVLLSSDSVESRMTTIAMNEIFGVKYLPVPEACQRIDAVTAEEVRRVAQGLLQDERRAILALGPKAPKALATKLRPEVPRRYCRT